MALLVVGAAMLWLGWVVSQGRQPTWVPGVWRETRLGLSGGVVALGGLAVVAGGWDPVTRAAAAVACMVAIGGVAVSWRPADR